MDIKAITSPGYQSIEKHENQSGIQLQFHHWALTTHAINNAFGRYFYPKQPTVDSRFHLLFQFMHSLGIKPTTLVLPTQCSTVRATGTPTITTTKSLSFVTANTLH